MVQQSTSGRVVTAVAVSNGNVNYCHAGETAWTAATNNSITTPALNASRLNFGTALNGILWLVDGLNYRQFDPATGIVDDWTATAGSLPTDNDGNTPRLIETWRGCVFMSGLIGDPYNWFICALGDPTNWDLAPISSSSSDAIIGSASPQGKIADMVTGFIPFTDDIGFLGCTHSLWLFNGDPRAGGSIDLISNNIGMAWGRAWCIDPYGTVYFMSNRMGIYTISPGSQPQRISQQIDNLLNDVDSGANTISLCWSEREQGVHVYITPTLGGAATHYFYEQRTGGWFQDVFNNGLHNPLCCCQFDGNSAEDRVELIGSFDGVVRFLDQNASTDDGRIIISSVIIGPISTENLDEMLLKEIQAVLGSDSSSVTYSILAGTTAEQALAQSARLTGTWNGGRNPTNFIRVASHVLYVEVGSNNPWRFEQARALIRTNGKIRRRAKD